MLGSTAVVTGPPAGAGAQGPAPEATSDATSVAARATRSEHRAEQVSRAVSRLLDGARVERRRTETACLDQTLSEINAVRRMLRHHRRGLDTAVGHERRRQATVFGVLEDRVDTLQLQAFRCEGRVVVGNGETRVITEISPDTPDLDPTVIPRPRGSAGSGRPGDTNSQVPPPGAL